MARIVDRYKKLFENLNKGKISRIYFLYGSEEYLKKEFISKLISAALLEGNRAFNLDVFYGDEFDKSSFEDRMSSYPLFTEKRMLIIKKFDALPTADKDYVLHRIDHIPDSLVLVIESPSDKIDSARARALKDAAGKSGVVFHFRSLSEGETIERVKNRLGREGLEITPDALDLLIESVGTKLIDLINEIEKIIITAEKGKLITRSDVSAVVGKYRTEGVFSFLDLLESKDLEKVLKYVDKLVECGEEPVFIVALMIRRVLMILQVKSLLASSPEKTLGAKAISSAMGGRVSPFYAGVLMRQANLFREDELRLFLVNLMWADAKLKASQIHPRNILEEAIIATSTRKKLASFTY